MTIFKSDPFPGTNYGQYRSWERVTAPNGAVYYVVPGFPQYVFDEVASNATGRKVFHPNPKAQYAAEEEQQSAQKKAIEQEQFNRSPFGQMLPIVGATGATIAASHLMPASASPLDKYLAAKLAGEEAAKAGIAGASTPAVSAAQGATQAANLTSGAAPVAQGFGATSAAAGAPYGVQTLADGATLMSDGSVVAPGLGVTPYLGAAGAALGAYGVYNASQMSNKRKGAMSGFMSGAGMGAGLGMAAPLLLGGGPLTWGALGLMALGGGGLGGIAGLAAHESTKDRSARRFGELAGMSQGNPVFQNMMTQGLEEDLSGVDTWDRGDDRSQAPIDLLTRSYGVLKTFGPEWGNIDQTKRQEIVKKMVDQDLINSKQGSYLVDDQAKAQEIKNQVLSQRQPAPQRRR